jgi:hypothetical protein
MTPKIITTCVNWAQYLRHTLPTWRLHANDVLVVTTIHDRETRNVAIENGARTFCTDDFFFDGIQKKYVYDGTVFNKSRALEYGFDALGRDDWILILDADIVLPKSMSLSPYDLNQKCLCSPWRRVHSLFDPNKDDVPNEADWKSFDICSADVKYDEYAGYFQLFHANAQTPPWYNPTKYKTAGMCDTEFWTRWTKECRIRITDFEVLHLGVPFGWVNHT